MLINREFKRKTPDRDAKKIYIFCEGQVREYDYFSFFAGLDSRISLIVYFLAHNENNSPEGLLEIAKERIKCCSFESGDELWIVFDTDNDKSASREPQINAVRNECTRKKHWHYAESNPCFELWLYYHFFPKKPDFENCDISSVWKNKLNELIPGGFDSRKHSLLIADAIENAGSNYAVNDENRPDTGSTELFKLGKTIYKIMTEKIDRMRRDSTAL